MFQNDSQRSGGSGFKLIDQSFKRRWIQIDAFDDEHIIRPSQNFKPHLRPTTTAGFGVYLDQITQGIAHKRSAFPSNKGEYHFAHGPMDDLNGIFGFGINQFQYTVIGRNKVHSRIGLGFTGYSMKGMAAAGMVKHLGVETLLQFFPQGRNPRTGFTGTIKPPDTQLASIFTDKFGGLFNKVFAKRRRGN